MKRDAPNNKSLSFVEIAFVKREASRFLSQSVYFSFATNATTTTLKTRLRVFSSKMRVRGERGEGDAFVSENKDDFDDAKRKKKRKRRRENGGALEWKDIVVAGTKKSEEDESFSHHHHSSEDFEDQEEEEKEEKEEGTDLDAVMKTVLAGRERKGKKMKTEEAFKKSRKREASRLKRELRNVNVKENNRNFERMFIGETLVDGVGRRRRATNTATSAGKMEDDTVEDDDEDNNNNSDEKKGWYYPCDWTLKTRATFAKICSLRDDDTNDEAEEDFDEDDDFDTDEEKRKIQQTFLSSPSVSKSFSWVNDERGANAVAAGAHDAFSTHGVNGVEPLSSKNCSFFYCLPSSSNSILSSESNKNDSRRSAAMQRATISFQYPDSRLPAHAIDKMNISFNNNKDLKSSSAATNAWFRQRSNQWTEALSSAYGRLRSYFSYSFYVAYEDRRIFFACPGLDGSFSSNSFKKENNNTKDDDDDDVNDKNDDKNNNISQGFAVITNTNQKLRDILTKNGIPFKPVFVTRDGKGFSVNDNRTKSDKMKNKKHLLFGGDANLFDVDDDDDEEKDNDDEGEEEEEEGEDNDEDDDDGKENAERENKKANLQQSGSQEEGNDGDKVKDDVKDEGEEDGCDDGYITNVVGKENSVKKKKNDDALLKNAIHPTFIDAWNESKRKIKLKEEQEKNKVFERFTRDGAILVRGTLAVHGLVNVLLQFRGQDPGDVKVTEQTVMDAEALALARMNTFAANTTNNTNTNTKNLTTTKAGSSAMISSDVGAILAPRPFTNCFTKSFELRPNKVAVASETSKSKLMRLWTLDLGSNSNSNNNNTSDSYSEKKNKMMMRTTNSDRKNWCDPCDLIPPWTMARVCRVLSAEDDFFGSNDNERDDDDAMMDDDKTIANEDDDKQKKKNNKNKNNNTVKQNILRENKNSIRLWLDTDPCSKVLNASVAAARLMSEESFSRRLRSTTKAAQQKKPEDEKKVSPPLKPRDEAFGDEDEKRWAFSFSSNNRRNRRANDFAAKSNNNDTGIVQSLELKKKAFVVEVACARSWK